MNERKYRPSGPLHWLLKHCRPQREWSILGCIGTEERSVAAYSAMQSLGNIAHTVMLRIADKHSRFHSAIEICLQDRFLEFVSSGGKPSEIADARLFDSHAEIVAIIDGFIRNANGSIILDITSLPKRFFFPFIRRILASAASASIRDLVVTYTQPTSYTKEPLAEDFNDWSQLPLFGGEYVGAAPKMLVIAAGFESLGLQEQLKGESDLPVKLLLPFPAPPAAFQRSWETIRRLRQQRSHEAFQIVRASAKDCADTFDRLVSLTDRNTQRAQLAPFGPKPMSLGMCLFAVRTNSEVFYTQPAVYNPNYSIGIARRNGVVDIQAFAIRLDGIDFFSI
jgi:hypothetical protein